MKIRLSMAAIALALAGNARAGVLSIPASAFQPTVDNGALWTNSTYTRGGAHTSWTVFHTTLAPTEMYAAVPLPGGVTITRFRCSVHDNHHGAEISVNLYEYSKLPSATTFTQRFLSGGVSTDSPEMVSPDLVLGGGVSYVTKNYDETTGKMYFYQIKYAQNGSGCDYPPNGGFNPSACGINNCIIEYN